MKKHLYKIKSCNGHENYENMFYVKNEAAAIIAFYQEHMSSFCITEIIKFIPHYSEEFN